MPALPPHAWPQTRAEPGCSGCADTDNDRLVSCKEFLAWIGDLKQLPTARDGTIGGSEHVEGEGGDGEAPKRVRLQDRSPRKHKVPFVAEHIALQRATMREHADLKSRKTGHLSAGEVVAVLMVRGRRMKVQRLKYQAHPPSGWVSDR